MDSILLENGNTFVTYYKHSENDIGMLVLNVIVDEKHVKIKFTDEDLNEIFNYIIKSKKSII